MCAFPTVRLSQEHAYVQTQANINFDISIIAHKDALQKEIAKFCSILFMEKAEKYREVCDVYPPAYTRRGYHRCKNIDVASEVNKKSASGTGEEA